MINNVVKSFAANAILALGATPIMSENIEEVEDLAQVNGAFLVNMGMVRPEDLELFIAAMNANNRAGNSVVLDPVAAGATKARKTAVKHILNHAYANVIKGNLGEIQTVAGLQGEMKGVDSTGEATVEEREKIATQLAATERCFVVLTGAVDVIATPSGFTVTIANGHPLMASITGSGCTLGSTIAACLAVVGYDEDLLPAIIVALLWYNIAAEWAVKQDGCTLGSFQSYFIDGLHYYSQNPEALYLQANYSIHLIK